MSFHVWEGGGLSIEEDAVAIDGWNFRSLS
jgi:hypothetical protein